MAFIKVESEDMKIEDVFTVKREDTEGQTEMVFIKEEREEVMIEEDFRVKSENTEEHTEMVLIKEEREEVTLEEDVRVKREDTEEHTEMELISEEREEMTTEDCRVKREDPKEQTEMALIKEEREEVTIEKDCRVKREDVEEQTEMELISEEREEMTTEDCRVKREDAEEQTVREGNCSENYPSGQLAAGLFQPYMFEPESDPECQDDEPTTPQISRMLQPVTAWCACKNCAVMPTEKENVCCFEIPEIVRRINEAPDALSCMTHHPGFEPVCLNVYSLQNALNIYKSDYGPLRLKGKARRLRHLAQRSFVSWCWGYLAKTIRVSLPSCVVLRISREFPAAADRPALR